MSGAVNKDPEAPGVPFWALASAGGAVLVALILAAIGGSPTTMPPASVLAQRMLRFDDSSSGAVFVSDADTGKQVAVLAPGTNGFIRATLRGLSHSGGHEEHVRANHPFRLTALSDGRLVLVDREANRTLDLEAFGSLNAAAFAALLSAPETAPQSAPKTIGPEPTE
jgi:putative photosynthetic complex assembly protein